MIVHVALFTWKDSAKASEIKATLKLVKSLKNKVDGLLDIRCGENYSKWNEGYTHAFVVTAKNQKALDAYRKHPVHKKK